MANTNGFTEITKVCRNCTRPFTISASEQAWFLDHGLTIPRRCQPCREQRRKADPKSGPAPLAGENRMQRSFR